MIIATATAQQQEGTSNRCIDLMIDSGAATHVCPPWFATESQIQPLTPENGPQLRTVTNQPIMLHGYKWVCVNNINGQRIVIPFYVCDIKQPILSVTRLIEQGFQIVLGDNPRIHHDKGFDSSITRSHGLLFLQAEIATLPRGTELKVDKEQGQVAMIAPTTTLTPQGAQCPGYVGDYWQFNSQGEYIGNTGRQCSHQHEHSARFRQTDLRTTEEQRYGATRTIEDRYQHLDNPNQAQPTLWKGETVFRLKKGTALPDTLQQQLAARQQQSQQKEVTTSRVTPQVIQYEPQRRITGKQPRQTVQQQQSGTTGSGQGIPHPSELQPGGDYWYREGPYWKRVHVQPRTAYYVPEQTDDGPDISKLSTDTTSSRRKHQASTGRMDN